MLVLVVGWYVLNPILSAVGDFTWADIGGNQAAESLGGVVALSLILLGGTALLAGVWLGLVEGRGRMVAATKETSQLTPKGFPITKELVEAIGKLRGASLLLVVGATVLLGSAWIAQSAVDPAGTAPNPTATTGATPTSAATAPTTTEPDPAPTPLPTASLPR